MQINNFKKHRKFTVVGTWNSGKTVFLTSLIHHLSRHNLETDQPILSFELDVKRSTFTAKTFWNEMTRNGKWPEKTLDCSQAICRFYINKCHPLKRKVVLELNDVPGERIADAMIYKNKSYKEWSEAFVLYLKSNIETDAAKRFRDVFSQANDAEEVRVAYKEMLGDFVKNDRYSEVSPSSFVLGCSLEGGKVEVDKKSIDTPSKYSDEQWRDYCINARWAGFPDEEFSPLPDKLLNADRALAKKMKSRYAKYRKKVVVPVFNMMRDSHGLIVLVDVLDCLAQGFHYKEACFSVVEEAVKIARPNSFWVWSKKQLKKAGQWSSVPVVERIAYVATKHDLVVHDQQDNMERLLAAECERLDRACGRVKDYQVFTCAAVVAAKEYLDDGKVEFHLRGEEQRQAAKSSKVPQKWPEPPNWGDFRFPVPSPHAEWRQKQEGMEKVVDFMLSLRRSR